MSTALAVLDDELARAVAAVRAKPSPLSRHAIDLAPERQAIVLDHVEHLRERLAAAVRVLGLRSPARVPITNTLRAVLMHAQVMLADLAPAKLRGYGLLGPEPAARVATVLSDLDRAIARLAAYLARPDKGDLAERIARLEGESARRDVLAQLERIATRHGLVELRPAIAGLVELLEVGTFEIALFGRVSCGKSSLINTVIGAEVLPVGATPVTALPTRVRWGPELAVDIRYADGRHGRMSVGALAELVTEAKNPENRLGIARVEIEVPAARLGGRLVLVDTPGVGSLATHGAREAYTYLPRCDLGVLVIEAASALSRDDLDLLRRLAESGIPAEVVLAKVDLVPPKDRERVRAYFAAEIERALGHALPVDLVSAVGEDAALAMRWFADRIVPLDARATEIVAASAARKLAALHASVLAILRVAAERGGGSTAPDVQQIEMLALEAESALRELSAHAAVVLARCQSAANAAIRAAAHAIAKTRSADPRGVLIDALAGEANAIRRALELDLISARAKLREAIATIARLGPAPVDDDVHVDLISQPDLELPPPVIATELEPSHWPGAERRLAARIDSMLGGAIDEAFRDLERRLRAWSDKAIASLGEQVASRIEPARAYARAACATPREDVAADLATLERL